MSGVLKNIRGKNKLCKLLPTTTRSYLEDKCQCTRAMTQSQWRVWKGWSIFARPPRSSPHRGFHESSRLTMGQLRRKEVWSCPTLSVIEIIRYHIGKVSWHSCHLGLVSDYCEEPHMSIKNFNPRQGYLRQPWVWRTRWKKSKCLKWEFSGGQGFCLMGFEVAQET